MRPGSGSPPELSEGKDEPLPESASVTASEALLAPQLPIELLEMIADVLLFDCRSLITMSLISRDFRAPPYPA